MDKLIADKDQALNVLEEIIRETAKIRTVSRKYSDLIYEEYKEISLYFLKELMNMIGTDEKNNGIGALAEDLDAICCKANTALEEYFEELE